ncbi:MAG: hypothetical protein KF803_11920 [Cyclobacteriaceae bacterium]|nr:hypothetical protein [Cyclobacteriaceae bacterium]
MQNRFILTFFLLIAVFFSCEREEALRTHTFDVTFAGVGIDCKLALIEFQEEDLSKIKSITGYDWLTYHAYNLDKEKYQIGEIITVVVRQTYDQELFFCTTLGPGFPWVTVIKDSQK